MICNADESEPGTFKDRLVMEGDPFAVLEGMTIAALATGAEQRLHLSSRRISTGGGTHRHAIEAARWEGFLGENILGSGMRFDIELRRGAGAYICGEETALFNSIEGYRGEPRNKPPFPTQAGLFRQPTVVNNVETLINVPMIINQGGAAYASVGTENFHRAATLLSLRTCSAPGIYEVAHGHNVAPVADHGRRCCRHRAFTGDPAGRRSRNFCFA